MRSCTYYDNHRRERCTECGQPIDLCPCEDPDYYAGNRIWSNEGFMIRAIWDELRQAREKHPVPNHLMVALTEEVGELANALLEYENGKKTPKEIFQEAVQIATVAIRVATEGDNEFSYEPFAVFGRE